MKRKSKLVMILLPVLLFITACGRNDDSANVSNDAYAENSIASMETADYTTADTPLRVSKYIPFDPEETKLSNTQPVFCSDAYGDMLCILVSYIPSDTLQTVHSLYRYDMDTNTLEGSPFTLPVPENSTYYIHSMEITGENELSFKIFEPYNYQTETPSYSLCKTDLNGQLLGDISPYPEEVNVPTDSEDGTTKVYHIPDGDSVIVERDGATVLSDIYQYNKERGQRTLVDTLPNEFITALCADGQDTIYFISNGYLNHYSLADKSGVRLCSLTECGISLYGTSHLLISDKGTLAVCVIDGENPGIYLLTDDEPVDEDSIRLTRLQTYGMEYVSKQAGFFTYDAGHTIRIEKEDSPEAQETFRDRIMAEIVAGGGPELLWVSEEDMYILAKKGALMDIGDLLSGEIIDQLLPGVLQLGNNDDMLVAITPEVSFHTLAANKSVWDGAHWTINDIIDAAESKEHWERAFSYAGPSIPAMGIYYYLLYDCLGDSPFMDLEQGISYFNGEDFIRTIEFCKKYGQDDNVVMTFDQRAELLREGETIAHVNYYFNGMVDFSSYMYMYDENCHIVGYPAVEGSGNYLYSEGYLVVNANAVHLEEIKEFLAYILDYDNQFTTTWSPVRKDVLRDRVIYRENRAFVDEIYVISKSNDPSRPIYMDIENKPDGSTYLEEFMTFVESCGPKPYCPQNIKDILAEELPTYFSGTKSAKETADIIHSRVQLYFDEHY